MLFKCPGCLFYREQTALESDVLESELVEELANVVNDSIVEPNETVSLTLSSPGGGGTLGSRSTAVLTIISDDQPGVIEFGAATYSVNESAGPAKIVVTRTGGTASNVTVDYATSDGTAVAPGDYAATGGAPLLGVNGVVIICHGGSPPLAIRNAIGVAAQSVDRRMVEHMAARLARPAEGSATE